MHLSDSDLELTHGGYFMQLYFLRIITREIHLKVSITQRSEEQEINSRRYRVVKHIFHSICSSHDVSLVIKHHTTILGILMFFFFSIVLLYEIYIYIFFVYQNKPMMCCFFQRPRYTLKQCLRVFECQGSREAGPRAVELVTCEQVSQPVSVEVTFVQG